MSGRREIAIGLGAYASYFTVRAIVWNERGRERADHNARTVASIERRLHIDIERRVQAQVLRWPRLIDTLNVSYAAGNVGLTVAWLFVLHRRSRQAYRSERSAALVAFAGALPFFAMFPTAPPRTLDGFVDTLAARGLALDHPLLVRFYNPIAAMPSHHVAFAITTGMGIARHASGPLRRAAWWSYPAVVAVVVIATANHFVLDVIGGAVLGAVGRKVAR